MRSLQLALLLAGCLLAGWAAAPAAASTKTRAGLLDQQAGRPVEELAAELCRPQAAAKPPAQRLGRISSIERLAEHLESALKVDKAGVDAVLVDCARRYAPIVRELATVVGQFNDNVCQRDKLALVEAFHHQYVSDTKEDQAARQESGQAPTPWLLKLFFMHYALEMSALCKKSLIMNLEYDLVVRLKEEPLDTELGQSLLGQLVARADLLSTSNDPRAAPVTDYDDVILVWDIFSRARFFENTAAGQQSADGPAVILEDSEGNKEAMVVAAKMHDAGPIRMIQESCLKRYKPVYDQLIMPIVRLSNMGYSYRGELIGRELAELKNNKEAHRWYGIMQFCEAIMPFRFYSEAGLPQGQCTLISSAEARQLEEVQAEMPRLEMLHFRPETNSMLGWDLLPTAELEAKQLIEAVDTRLSERERSVRRLVSKLFHKITSVLRTKTPLKLFLSRPAAAGQAEQRVDDLQQVLAGFEGGQVSEQQLLQMQASVKREKQRRRPGDVVARRKSESAAVSYMHTKSWSEVFATVARFANSVTPAPWLIWVVGGFICTMLVGAIVVLSMTG